TVFDGIASAHAYRLDSAARPALREWFARQHRGPTFGNARVTRNLFEATVAQQAMRLADVAEPSEDDLRMLGTAALPEIVARSAGDSVRPTMKCERRPL